MAAPATCWRARSRRASRRTPSTPSGCGRLQEATAIRAWSRIVEAALPHVTLDDVLDSPAEPPLIVVLDGVTDPHNLGACLRSADAFGAHAVVVPKDRSAGVNATVAKAASGAADTVPVIAVTNLARTLRDLQSRGLWIIGADTGGENLFDAELSGPIAWVLGAEGAGLRRLTRESCDRIVGIPLFGSVESLTCRSPPGICLFATRRARASRRALRFALDWGIIRASLTKFPGIPRGEDPMKIKLAHRRGRCRARCRPGARPCRPCQRHARLLLRRQPRRLPAAVLQHRHDVRCGFGADVQPPGRVRDRHDEHRARAGRIVDGFAGRQAYTFKLRKGVKFHSNANFKPTRDFNADDVLFCWSAWRTKRTRSTRSPPARPTRTSRTWG